MIELDRNKNKRHITLTRNNTISTAEIVHKIFYGLLPRGDDISCIFSIKWCRMRLFQIPAENLSVYLSVIIHFHGKHFIFPVDMKTFLHTVSYFLQIHFYFQLHTWFNKIAFTTSMKCGDGRSLNQTAFFHYLEWKPKKLCLHGDKIIDVNTIGLMDKFVVSTARLSWKSIVRYNCMQKEMESQVEKKRTFPT